MLAQIMGNPASCWELIAYASRAIVALGYHTITDADPKNDLNEEIHAVVAWCSHFDSCMSLALLRPRSLPPLNVRESTLIKTDPANPLGVFDHIAMDMIPVHDKILKLTLEANAKRPSATLREEVAWLREVMSDILRHMERVSWWNKP
jgi:hypothetical protein